jgi:hypothetical protein
MTTKQYILLGVAVTGNFNRNWGMSTNQDYSMLGIPRDVSDHFFSRIAAPISKLKEMTEGLQSYGADWLYTWNPLEGTPLIRVDPLYPDRVVCPIPRFLFRRFSSGIFYDLVKASDFDNSFGNSFQAYAGEALKAYLHDPFSIIAPEPYFVGKDKKHGTDWIVSDQNAHVFVECKSKRLTLNARTKTEPSALQRDIRILAEAIVQNYKNIDDVVEGRANWLAHGKPIYSFIVTLEDWFMLSPGVREMLDSEIVRLFELERLSPQLLKSSPYTLLSVHELEIVAQVIAQVGVEAVMARKVSTERHSWSFLPFLGQEFSAELKNVEWGRHRNELNRFFGEFPGVMSV